jgi:type IV pilus assembly protein PilQ
MRIHSGIAQALFCITLLLLTAGFSPAQAAGEETAPASVDAAASSLSELAAAPAVPTDGLPRLTSITTKDQTIFLELDQPLQDYRVMKLANPERIAIDLLQTTSALVTKTIPLNVGGVATARIGVYPDKTRIVLDAVGETFPKYSVLPSAKGIMVELGPVVSAVKPPLQAVAAAAAPAPVKAATSGKGAVQSIDYQQLEASSKLLVKFDGACTASEPIKKNSMVTFTLRNCTLPNKLQRSLDTGSFKGNVSKVTAYPVKVKGGTDTRFAVSLHEDAPFTFATSEGQLILDVPVVERAATDEIQPPRAKAEARVPVAEPLLTQSADSKTSLKKVYTGRRVTMEFSDADVRRIFQLIAEVSNLNFLIADDVTGIISIKLVNVPWDQALDVILEAKNLGMVRDGNIVQIRPKNKILSLADEETAARRARERTMELQTEVFNVNFATLGDVVTQFSSIKSERGTINPDARTNKVIVKDIQPSLEEMRTLLRSLDAPEQQVMIEARIVEASSDFTRDIGVRWGVVDESSQKLGITDATAGLGGALSPTDVLGTAIAGPGAAASMTFGRLINNTLIDLRLSAAATAGMVKIISTPKVMTLNNKAAKISQGQSIPYQTTSAEGTKTEFIEAALTLEVTPHITPDGTIMMKIKASNNSPGTGNPPPINKKEATTEMLVRNGETTVIGGIFVDTDNEADEGVPFLMDIPLFGWLFKSNSKFKSKSELLIFITPRIVS